MRYNHTAEESAEFLRLTLRHLGEHRLPSHPVNYTVWYEYVSQLNHPLASAIEDCLTGAVPVTPELTHLWYQEHVADRGQNLVQAIKTDLLNILNEVFNDLSHADGNLAGFGAGLARLSEKIAHAGDKQALQESLRALLLEVKQVGEMSAGLAQRLHQANEQVESLQSKLREAEQFATTDALTGLWNRRSFEEKLSHHMARSRKDGRDLTLIILDVDHFKHINDSYGHLTGDDLLRIIAKTLKDYVKGKDLVCRYGGEEFVVLLPDTPLRGGVVVAEKIRKHFSQMSWKQKRTGVSMGKVTLSSGVATYRPPENMEQFFQRADVALYRSKKDGRNRVTVEKP